MKYKDIVDLNNKVYNKLAVEYNDRMDLYTEHQKNVLEPFIEILLNFFNDDINTLDVGCGVGLDLKLMNDQGFKTYGIDYSIKMCNFSEMNNPTSTIINGDFTKYNFEKKFHGVLMDAFIHLFPKDDISEIFLKLDEILLSDGFAFISTTKHNNAKEGLFKKEDYKSEIKRYRAYWTENELKNTLVDFGFEIVKKYGDYENNYNKNWMNFIIKKTP